MESLRGSWLLLFIFSLLFHNSSAKHGEKLPSAIVIGTVYCDTCFQQGFSKNSYFMSGASVAIECDEKGLKSSFRKEVKTNDHGVFEVSLPFAVGKHVKKIKKCSVKLTSSSDPYCAVDATATSSSLHLKSTKQGLYIFSAGIFTFKPLKQPELCYKKPRRATSLTFKSTKTLVPYPDIPTIPPVNQSLPIINLPPLPTIPSIPTLPPLFNIGPVPKPAATSDQTIPDRPTVFFPPIIPSPPAFGIPLPPNPLQPPPRLPPVPILNPPSPPFLPPIFPPNPLQPPLIPIFNPPSSPPPVLPFPFPPLPFPPFPPIFPGIPPASPSRRTTP